ncbi:MAG TPA: hypothetical protein VII44_07435 [Puia sp.]
MAAIHRNQGVKQIILKLKLSILYGNKEKENVLAKYKYLFVGDYAFGFGMAS